MFFLQSKQFAHNNSYYEYIMHKFLTLFTIEMHGENKRKAMIKNSFHPTIIFILNLRLLDYFMLYLCLGMPY